jgi:hypothetical protein
MIRQEKLRIEHEEQHEERHLRAEEKADAKQHEFILKILKLMKNN